MPMTTFSNQEQRRSGLRPSSYLRRIQVAIILATVLLSSTTALAQTKRILLIGDSWAAQMWSEGVVDTALVNKGLSDFSSHGGPTTIGGSTAASWTSASRLNTITQELTNNPTLDIIHLSIGGNDLLGAPDPVAAIPQMLADIQTIVDHILTIRPNARIVIWPYDYTVGGDPTASGGLAQALIDQAALTSELYVLNTLGVLHHSFGYPPNFSAGERPLPGGYPNYTPLIGGDPAFGADPSTFRDSIHPTTASYVALMEHGIDEFYGEWLQPEIDAVPSLGLIGISLLIGLVCVASFRELGRPNHG
jgi:hypothetical protein